MDKSDQYPAEIEVVSEPAMFSQLHSITYGRQTCNFLEHLNI